MSFQQGTRVKVTKLGPVKNPFDSNPALETGYWLEGKIVNPPATGQELLVLRDNRNSVQMLGIFSTSKIMDVEEVGPTLKIYTRNSIYLMEKINDGLD